MSEKGQNVAEPEERAEYEVPLTGSRLAWAMLEWEALQREADRLAEPIKAAILAGGETVVVGDVRATFNNPRKRYDYGAAFESTYGLALDAGDDGRIAELDEVRDEFSMVKVDYRKAVDKAQIEDVPYTEGDASVTLKLL